MHACMCACTYYCTNRNSGIMLTHPRAIHYAPPSCPPVHLSMYTCLAQLQKRHTHAFVGGKKKKIEKKKKEQGKQEKQKLPYRKRAGTENGQNPSIRAHSCTMGNRSSSHSLNACSACVSETTRRLRPLFSPDPDSDPDPAPAPAVLVTVGLFRSSHFRNTRFKSRGIPSSTTVDMGTKGRSSIPDARMAYSCAKSRALRNDEYCELARDPTMM